MVYAIDVRTGVVGDSSGFFFFQIYIGSISHPEIIKRVEGAKLIISIGAILSDFNTGGFTYHIPKSKTVEVRALLLDTSTWSSLLSRSSFQLHSDHSWVLDALYPGIGFKWLLPNLTAKLAEFSIVAQDIPVPPFVYPIPIDPGDVISHAWLWPRLGEFFGPKDVILTETGTAEFGILDVPLPEGAKLITQFLWGSIGYTVGACLGAACGARDSGLGRTILFVGDGSL